MHIANPLYYVFFKFLFEDTNITKKLLSALLDTEILSLEPCRYKNELLTGLHVNFKAVILTKEGIEKKALIELHKTRILFDMVCLRKYLADGYTYQDKVQNTNEKETLPIITVYFLNFKLANVKFPLLKVNRQYSDLVSKENYEIRNEFVEQLTHDCYVIQVPRLRLNMQNRIEKLLSVFNQKYVTTKDNKIMSLPVEWNEDPELRELIERLNYPLQDQMMIQRAEAEDEIESKFEEIERKLAEAQQAQQKAELEKQALLAKTEMAIKNLVLLGLTNSQIAAALQIAESEVEKVII